MRCLALVALVGCSSSAPPAEPPPVVALHDAVVGGLADAFALVPDPRRWFAGDVHMHVSPPDDPADVTLSAARIAEAARKAELDFVVLTPHLWPARWSAAFRSQWRSLATTARAASRPTLIPGVEWTTGGGTDNHKLNVMATTWVLAPDASERAILDALRAGATCVGGPEAGTLRVGGDGPWAWIGGSVHASPAATLAWDGTARVFIDGIDRGEHTGGFTHDTGGQLHTYRIEQGASRCGFVYANL